MPTYSDTNCADPRAEKESSPDSIQQDGAVAEQDLETREGSKEKNKHAATKQLSSADAAEMSSDAEAPRQRSRSPVRPQSILGQLPQHFLQARKASVQDMLSELNTSQKVSDEHTPPTETWARSVSNGRSPLVEPIPGLSVPASPPFEPGFLGRGGFNSRSPPVSPQRKARAVSYGGPIPTLPVHTSRASTSPYGYGTSAYGSPPAPPHLPQQHFYGVHDIDLGISQPKHQRLQEPVLLKFTTIPGAAHDARHGVFLSIDRDLNVLAFNGERIEQIGALYGLAGTILDAVFLTWDRGDDPFEDYRPLVALTVYGPRTPEMDQVNNPTGASMARDQLTPEDVDVGLDTRIEVYSLSRNRFVAELLSVPSLPTPPPFPGIPSPPSGPIGSLKVQASGNFLTISSGSSGEIFTFGVRKGQESGMFECLGKYWTTTQPLVQRRDSTHGSASDADVSPADVGRRQDGDNVPIGSLHGRWLAYCPASIPSRPTIGASLGPGVVYSKFANLSAGTAPSRPAISCEVESPDVDTFFGKVSRGFAQEVVRGTRWLGEKGLQTWQSYWKKDGAVSGAVAGSSSSSPPMFSPPPMFAQFPPTHGSDVSQAAKEPELVTIVDLKIVQENQARKMSDGYGTVATFQPPGGCSFLSFMPTGLGLLTATKKGDLQYVWDLMELKYTRPSRVPASGESVRSPAHVRQLAKYIRLSPSTIVDVVWEAPIGNRLALLTKNRTVHIFDVPLAAFRWPPPRLPQKSRPTSAPVDPSLVSGQHEPAPTGGFLASAMSIAGRTQPILANLRGRAPSIGGGIAGIGVTGIGLASTTSIKGGKAVAAGLSKSLGAATETVSNIRHAGQSRLHLKIAAKPGILVWQRRDQRPGLCVLDPVAIRTYYVRKTKPRDSRQQDTASVFEARKAVGTKMPSRPDLMRDFMAWQSVRGEKSHEAVQNANVGFWKSRSVREVISNAIHPLAHAEIETSAPYQPFHADHRVTLSVYPEDHQLIASPLPTASAVFQPPSQPISSTSPEKWVFGNEIAATRLNVTVVQHESRGDHLEESVPYEETRLTPAVHDEVEQIASATRRRKYKAGRSPIDGEEMLSEEGFFEDDYDVLDFTPDRV